MGTTTKERKAYREHVWLTENEYLSVKKNTGDDWGCELALNILEQYKVARGKTKDTAHDYLMLKSWVFDIVEIKRMRREHYAAFQNEPPHDEGEKLMRVKVTDTQNHSHICVVTELKYWQLKETNAVMSVEILDENFSKP